MSIFKKYASNPVFGKPETGSFFDPYVTWDGTRYRMDFSDRMNKACAVSFSRDGIHWDAPQITLPPHPLSGWEDHVNRNCVIRENGRYQMWYTGQARGYSFLGYAESTDGIHFSRCSDEPILVPEFPWEKESVMNPCVRYEAGRYRMWYSAGETYEPNVIAYAESSDGIHWQKRKANPIFVCDRHHPFEQNRIGGCCVVKTHDAYVLFYIGYEDIDTARICAAKSHDGVVGWTRTPLNPLLEPDANGWDGDACYKPAALWNETAQKWMLWYNGRRGNAERIGLATCDRFDLFDARNLSRKNSQNV